MHTGQPCFADLHHSGCTLPKMHSVFASMNQQNHRESVSQTEHSIVLCLEQANNFSKKQCICMLVVSSCKGCQPFLLCLLSYFDAQQCKMSFTCMLPTPSLVMLAPHLRDPFTNTKSYLNTLPPVST
jgi:hypothetical protein